MRPMKWNVLSLALVGGLALGACADDEPLEEATEEGEPAIEAPAFEEPTAAEPGIAVVQIVQDPSAWVGQTVSGEVRVVEVPTDRGFWIEGQGDRLFVLIVDEPQEVPKDINANTTIRLESATVRDPSYLPDLPGRPITSATEAIIRDEGVFLVVDEADIDMMEAGES